MRYIVSYPHEAYESQFLPAVFHTIYSPQGRVTVEQGSILTNNGVDLISIEGKKLAIGPNTASWAFLTEREAEMFLLLEGIKFGKLHELWPDDACSEPQDYITQLYRRGLLSINGYTAVDPSLFEDSHNTVEQHLVELLLTEKCNLACGYCLAGTGLDMPAMTEEVAFRAIELAFMMHEARSLTFEFSGGEPFLMFALMSKLIDFIRNHPSALGREVYITLQTNATMLSQQKIEWLKENNVYVGISLDGGPEYQDKSRPMINGSRSYPKVIRGIRLLQRNGVPFGVLVVLTRTNRDSARKMINFLTDNGIYSLKLNPVAFLGKGQKNWNEFGLSTEEVIRYFKNFMSALVSEGELIHEANIATMLTHLVSKMRKTRCMRTYCGAGESFQAINPVGDIFPCGRATQIPELKIGNVLNHMYSLSAPGRLNKYVQEIKERRPSELMNCATCSYRQLCQAGCPLLALNSHGLIQSPTSECDFYKTMYPYLMKWLSFDLKAFSFFREAGYFSGTAEIVVRDYL